MKKHLSTEPITIPPNTHTELPAILRYWDDMREKNVAKIQPGEFCIAQSGELIMTILGSCIAACVRDHKLRIGGMNHFMLPLKGNIHDRNDIPAYAEACRYGNWAMELLINNILKRGGKRRNLEIKIFGGAKLSAPMHNSYSNIGIKNIEFIMQYIHDENLRLSAKHLGGIYPRVIIFDPYTGNVKMKVARHTALEPITVSEQHYFEQLISKSSSGDVELF